jgi:hypothetical protein
MTGNIIPLLDPARQYAENIPQEDLDREVSFHPATGTQIMRYVKGKLPFPFSLTGYHGGGKTFLVRKVLPDALYLPMTDEPCWSKDDISALGEQGVVVDDIDYWMHHPVGEPELVGEKLELLEWIIDLPKDQHIPVLLTRKASLEEYARSGENTPWEKPLKRVMRALQEQELLLPTSFTQFPAPRHFIMYLHFHGIEYDIEGLEIIYKIMPNLRSLHRAILMCEGTLTYEKLRGEAKNILRQMKGRESKYKSLNALPAYLPRDPDAFRERFKLVCDHYHLGDSEPQEWASYYEGESSDVERRKEYLNTIRHLFLNDIHTKGKCAKERDREVERMQKSGVLKLFAQWEHGNADTAILMKPFRTALTSILNPKKI